MRSVAPLLTTVTSHPRSGDVSVPLSHLTASLLSARAPANPFVSSQTGLKPLLRTLSGLVLHGTRRTEASSRYASRTRMLTKRASTVPHSHPVNRKRQRRFAVPAGATEHPQCFSTAREPFVKERRLTNLQLVHVCTVSSIDALVQRQPELSPCLSWFSQRPYVWWSVRRRSVLSRLSIEPFLSD